MEIEQVQIAERQLDRVLQFASRIENKVSVLLATNLGVLAIALMNLDYRDISTWYVAAPLFLALFFISSSLFHLYHATYPNLVGGSNSLIYFSEIAKRTEQNYAKDFKAISLEDLHSDLTGQIWRNSQIITEKFSSVKKAFVWTILSIAPWSLFLAASSVIHSRAILVN